VLSPLVRMRDLPGRPDGATDAVVGAQG